MMINIYASVLLKHCIDVAHVTSISLQFASLAPSPDVT